MEIEWGPERRVANCIAENTRLVLLIQAHMTPISPKASPSANTPVAMESTANGVRALLWARSLQTLWQINIIMCRTRPSCFKLLIRLTDAIHLFFPLFWE